MACRSCGGGQILRVERMPTNGRPSAPKLSPQKLGVQKTTVRTVAAKPANHLDKHRA